MKLLTIALLSMLLMTGCIPAIEFDLAGFTRRAQIRADGYVAQEHERTLARQAEAQAKVDQELARQAGSNNRTATVMMILPVIVLIVIAGLIVRRVIDWKAKIHLESMRLSQRSPLDKWQALADRAGAKLVVVDKQPWAVWQNGKRKMIVKRR